MGYCKPRGPSAGLNDGVKRTKKKKNRHVGKQTKGKNPDCQEGNWIHEGEKDE